MDWRADLENRLKGRIAVMGVGNMLRADDALGPRVASALSRTEGLTPFNCESVPEKWLGPVRRYGPDVILFVDVADFGGEPGEIRVLDPADLAGLHAAGTHAMSSGFLMELFTQSTRASSFMLAVQPSTIELGEPMSEACERATQEIIEELSRYSS